MNKKETKILVGMSGGVDSSVTAALLVKEGYTVTGAYMKQWSDSEKVSGVCPWKEDRRDALRVAAHLGIDLITLDFEKEYKEWVMEYMFAEYEDGRTPNPDVMCNKFIKFGSWLEKARELGYDYLATGHYAKLENSHLSIGKDKEKDQTYFLHQVTAEQLSSVLFPLGDYTKDEVRGLAEKFELPTAKRPESMGICFVGEVPIKEFLEQKIDHKPGNIITDDGTVVGEHDGLTFYTIGQRNINIESSKVKDQQGENKPLYVVHKKHDTNELVVGFEDNPLLYTDKINVEDVHWISGQEPEFPLQCSVRLRHRQELQEVTVNKQNTDVDITFSQKQKAVTPGQFAVFYKDNECLGGAIIK
jgi:tRNA-uridine 2-sulfurtransferase